MAEGDKTFDFQQHAQRAVAAYLERRGFFEDLALVVRRIVEEALKRRSIKVQTVCATARGSRQSP